MNKRAFNARAQTGRHIASIAKQCNDAWAYDQAKVYAANGFIGPDLIRWLEWYWRGDEFPRTPMGASTEAFRRGW